MTRDALSRRAFGKRVALAAAAPQGRGGQPPLPAAAQSEVDAKFADVVRKYGDRLTDEQKTRVRTTLARHQRMLMRVREFPLENGDAPAKVRG